MADIITLNELRTARGDAASNTSNDSRYTWMIPVASQMIRTFTGRDFGAPQLTETRPFVYDGSGFLDIDDASAISEVAIPPYGGVGDRLVLDAAQWIAMPPRRDDAPVFWYLLIPMLNTAYGFSPEMGFNRNLDVYYRENRLPVVPQTVEVTATWGWPSVPVDVKQAAVWVIEDWLGRDSGEGLSSEAIAGYARSWARGTQEAPMGLAIPGRARDVLAAYEKHYV